MAKLLRRGAERLLKTEPDPDKLVQAVFQSALARDPTEQERITCRQLLGSPPTREGAEDLLWAIVMLPEFQLIR